MKISQILMVFALCVASQVFASDETWPIQSDGCIQFPDGVKCDLFQVASAQEITLIGSADYGFVYSRVSKYGYKPVHLKGRAAVGIDIIKFDQTNIGPYLEFVLYYPVQKAKYDFWFSDASDFLLRFNNKNEDPADPAILFYTERLILDLNGPHTDSLNFAIQTGRNIYGFAKERGSISMNLASDSSKTVSVESASGDFKFQADFRSLGVMVNLKGSAPRDVMTVSVKNDLPVLSRSLGSAVACLPIDVNAFFNPSVFSIDFGPELSGLDFKPLSWVFLSRGNWQFGPAARFNQN